MNHSNQDQHSTGQYPNAQHRNDQYQPHPPPADEPETPPKKRRRWPWVAGIIVALLAGVGIGSDGETEPEIVTETETETETITEEVEVEVEPADLGERREAIAEDEDALETRASELDDREDALDAREEELASQAEDEAATEEAEQEETSASDSGSIPGSGTFLIGEDIQPGTYRTEGDSGFCYWARLSGLSGEFEDIITNDFSEGPSFVTLSETDVAFETSDCGEWTAQ